MRATLTDNDLEQLQTWADHGAPVWGSRSDVSDGERWRASEVQAHVSARFVVRWSPFTDAITPKDRLRVDGQTFDISGRKLVGRNDRIEFTAAARADL
jgi:head-tail adaptor